MVTVTDKAKERISAIIKEENYDNTYFVRVAVESGGCSIILMLQELVLAERVSLYKKK